MHLNKCPNQEKPVSNYRVTDRLSLGLQGIDSPEVEALAGL